MDYGHYCFVTELARIAAHRISMRISFRLVVARVFSGWLHGHTGWGPLISFLHPRYPTTGKGGGGGGGFEHPRLAEVFPNCSVAFYDTRSESPGKYCYPIPARGVVRRGTQVGLSPVRLTFRFTIVVYGHCLVRLPCIVNKTVK